MESGRFFLTKSTRRLHKGTERFGFLTAEVSGNSNHVLSTADDDTEGKALGRRDL